MRRDYRYLVTHRMLIQTAKKWIYLVLGGFWSFLFVVGLCMSLFGDDPTLKDAETRIIVLVMLAVSGLVLWRGLLAAKVVSRGPLYDSIFQMDRDGFVSLQEMVRQTGKDPQQVLKELGLLFDRRCFTNCSFQRLENPGVFLGDALPDDTPAGYVTVTCTACGATNRLKLGATGACRVCQAPVQGVHQ